LPTRKKKTDDGLSQEPSWDEIGRAVGMKIEKYKNEDWKKCDCMCRHRFARSCSGGAVYGLGFIGAAVYYISTATSFWMGVLGVLKAIFWPAFLIYGLMRSLGL
jgi:hypothetical protein